MNKIFHLKISFYDIGQNSCSEQSNDQSLETQIMNPPTTGFRTILHYATIPPKKWNN